MTTPTREQVVQWAKESHFNFDMGHQTAVFTSLKKVEQFATLARADLEADIAKQQSLTEAAIQVAESTQKRAERLEETIAEQTKQIALQEGVINKLDDEYEAKLAEQAKQLEVLTKLVGPDALPSQGLSHQVLPTSAGGGDENTGTNSGMYHERDKCIECLQQDKARLVKQLEEMAAAIASLDLDARDKLVANSCACLASNYAFKETPASYALYVKNVAKAILAVEWKKYL